LVCAEYRNKGIGSKFLNILKKNGKNYGRIIVEVEKVEFRYCNRYYNKNYKIL
jgi:GNAT superfamily N-acetyltransferase